MEKPCNWWKIANTTQFYKPYRQKFKHIDFSRFIIPAKSLIKKWGMSSLMFKMGDIYLSIPKKFVDLSKFDSNKYEIRISQKKKFWVYENKPSRSKIVENICTQKYGAQIQSKLQKVHEYFMAFESSQRLLKISSEAARKKDLEFYEYIKNFNSKKYYTDLNEFLETIKEKTIDIIEDPPKSKTSNNKPEEKIDIEELLKKV